MVLRAGLPFDCSSSCSLLFYYFHYIYVFEHSNNFGTVLVYSESASTFFYLDSISVYYLSGLFSVNGGWGLWTPFTYCSWNTGRGMQTRQRVCNNPIPSNGGALCQGDSEDRQTCKSERCPGMCKPTFSSRNIWYRFFFNAWVSGIVTNTRCMRTMKFYFKLLVLWVKKNYRLFPPVPCWYLSVSFIANPPSLWEYIDCQLVSYIVSSGNSYMEKSKKYAKIRNWINQNTNPALKTKTGNN